MTATQLCTFLKQELFDKDYDYGFFFEGKKYIPNADSGFDASFALAMKELYRIQEPSVTMVEKIGTCLDAVLVMKALLDPLNVPSKIWLLIHRVTKTPHTVLTFECDGKVVYLELTPRSGKPCYGKELLYDSEKAFVDYMQSEDYDIAEATEKVTPGISPDSLLQSFSTLG